MTISSDNYHNFVYQDNGIGFDSTNFDPFLLFAKTKNSDGDGVGFSHGKTNYRKSFR